MPDEARFDPSLVPHVMRRLDDIAAQIASTESRRKRDKVTTFCLDVGMPCVITRTQRGILKYIHNPNAVAIAFELRELLSNRIMWSGQLAAGNQAGVYVPFAAGINCTVCASPANAIIIAGDYDSNE